MHAEKCKGGCDACNLLLKYILKIGGKIDGKIVIKQK